MWRRLQRQYGVGDEEGLKLRQPRRVHTRGRCHAVEPAPEHQVRRRRLRAVGETRVGGRAAIAVGPAHLAHAGDVGGVGELGQRHAPVAEAREHERVVGLLHQDGAAVGERELEAPAAELGLRGGCEETPGLVVE